ncbi:MAG TPA: DUF5715 family protein [Prolixibacteraceae bacterium]|nr:DUF5715 family protein [Prolixibacteraceae bacterium]
MQFLNISLPERMGDNSSGSFLTLLRRRKLKKPVKRFLTGVFILIALIILFPLFRGLFDPSDEISTGNTRVHRFRDLNEVHLRYARSNGISPLASKKVLDNKLNELQRSKKLVKIEETRTYSVDKLTHSHPYLVPKARKLLDLIGERFQQKLKQNNLENYQFRITSLLRTQESQRSLGFSNVNATSKSAHLYGTTFDITYKSLSKRNLLGRNRKVHDGTAIRLLSETIRELQKERRLVVVTERKEACFHITVR